MRRIKQWLIHRGCVPQISGDSHAKASHVLAHNDAIAGFTSQSLGLPAYACKTGSSTAIKFAPRMHRNLPFRAQKIWKEILGGNIALPRTSPMWRGHPSLHPTTLGASFLALAVIRPPLFKPWIRPWSNMTLFPRVRQVAAQSDRGRSLMPCYIDKISYISVSILHCDR